MLYRLTISLSRPQKCAILLFIDVAIIALSFLLAVALLSGTDGMFRRHDNLLIDLAAMMAAGTAMTMVLGLHRIKLNAYEMHGVMATALTAGTIVLAGIASSALLSGTSVSIQVFTVAGMLFLILSVMARLALRSFLIGIYKSGEKRVNIIIYGAGQTGQQLAKALVLDDAVLPVAYVDDDPRLRGLTVAGMRVHAPARLPSLIRQHNVGRIVLAMPSTSRAVQSAISQRLQPLGCEVHALPSFADLVANQTRNILDTRPIDPKDLLGRAQLVDELPGVSDIYEGRTVMVTGAGGSIGSELCRQLAGCGPTRLVLLDHGEHALFQIHRELAIFAPGLDLHPVLGNVCDKTLIDEVIETHGVDIILHAAAYKHVPLVEQNAVEGVRNNVYGTRTVAEAARDHRIEHFILISTDKAVRPSSIMGASKRLAEMVVQDLATRSGATGFSMVRFGNVLGSSGSVIPLFRDQIANGGPVTLTHAGVTRYFMTVSEAVRLVLLAGSLARGGDVFVLDMGEPVLVRNLARQMIESAGMTVRDARNPGGDIEIKVVGLRPGEKLHEELLIGSDSLTTPHPKILRALEGHPSEIEMANLLQSLRHAIEARNISAIYEIADRWLEKPGAETGPSSVLQRDRIGTLAGE